jgi:hypothetical protein
MILNYFIADNCKCGFIDIDNNIIIKPIYDDVFDFDKHNNFTTVKFNGKWGAINSKNETLLDFKYKALLRLSNDIDNILIYSETRFKFGLMTISNIIITDDIFDFDYLIKNSENILLSYNRKNKIQNLM